MTDAEVPHRRAQFERDAAAHSAPLTPGLEITEADPDLAQLYEDLQLSQPTWRYLVERMPEEQLYWLAAHRVRPSSMTDDDRWQKLSQNARRARWAVERRAADRAAESTAEEHDRGRKAQLAAALIGAGVALLVVFLTNLFEWFDDEGDGGPLQVELVDPTTTTTP